MINYTPTNIRTWSRLGSCGAYGIAIMELFERNNNIAVLTADLTVFSGLERFKSKYPEDLYNIGIAEQNLIGVAAGMAKEGAIPFASTYAAFAASRCCDQVRVNMGYMELGVKLVGLTSGLSVGILGATHMSIEDVAVMRSIPNITVLSPADCTETIKATFAAAEIDGPVYLRLSGAMNTPIVYREDYEFEIGKSITLKEGGDISIIASGTMVHYSLKVAEELETQGISCSVINMHTIKPLDKEAIAKACSSQLIVTVEEHSIHGGLGSAIAEYLADKPEKPQQLIIGIPDTFYHAATYDYLLKQSGLTIEDIKARIQQKYMEIK